MKVKTPGELIKNTDLQETHTPPISLAETALEFRDS